MRNEPLHPEDIKCAIYKRGQIIGRFSTPYWCQLRKYQEKLFGRRYLSVNKS